MLRKPCTHLPRPLRLGRDGSPKPRVAETGKERRKTTICIRKKKQKVLLAEHSGSEDGSWEGPSTAEEMDEEVTMSPSMQKIFTRLQERRLLTPGGGASAISGPAN
jgi:hypothetical protein